MVKKANDIETIDTSDSVKEAEYDTKIANIEKKILDHNHDKYITTQELNKLTADNFVARLKQANLASKNDSADFVKKGYFNEKIIDINKKATVNKTKYVKWITNIWFKSFYHYFSNDGSQSFWIFQPIYETLTTFAGLSNTITE